MRNKTISISSDSDSCSDDDLPLTMIKTNGCTEDPNSYNSLCRHSIHACEFCDRISNNRYSSLIHNVRHIIIPLLKQNVIQCPICLHHFTSEKELRIHSLKKHPNIKAVCLVPLVKNEYGCKQCRSSLSSSCNCAKALTPLKSIHNNVKTPEIDRSITKTVNTKVESMKNRLVFEDDDIVLLDCNRLLNDLTTDCKVNIEVFDTPWMNGQFSRKSIHYDELVKPGVYRCKKCGKGFPTRYDAIIHETSHIKFKNSRVRLCVICKKSVIGSQNDLRHHHATHHEDINKQESTKINKEFVYESKLLSLCDVCYSFCQKRPFTNWEVIKTINKYDKELQCDECELLFCEIKLVRRIRRRRQHYTHGPKKRKTNEERLKIIQNRFKMMKNYFFVFYFNN